MRYNFTERWKIQKARKRIKPFHKNSEQPKLKIICYETQAIQKKRTRKKKESSSEEEHKVNALASGADEGRDKLR